MADARLEQLARLRRRKKNIEELITRRIFTLLKVCRLETVAVRWMRQKNGAKKINKDFILLQNNPFHEEDEW